MQSRSRRWLQKHFEGRCRADDNFRSNHQDRLLAHWVSNNRLLVENIFNTFIWLLFNHFNMIALQAKVSQKEVSVQAITFLKRLWFLVFCCENYVSFNNQREFSAVILLSKNWHILQYSAHSLFSIKLHWLQFQKILDENNLCFWLMKMIKLLLMMINISFLHDLKQRSLATLQLWLRSVSLDNSQFVRSKLYLMVGFIIDQLYNTLLRHPPLY